MSSEREMNVVNHNGGCLEVRVASNNVDRNLNIKRESVFTGESRKMQIDVGPGGGLRQGSQLTFDATSFRDHQGSILSTATRNNFATGKLTESSLVRVGGMQVTIREAVEMGWLEKDGKGGFREVSQESGPFAGSQASESKNSPEPTIEIDIGDSAKEAATWLSQSLGVDLEARIFQVGSHMFDGKPEEAVKAIKSIAASAGVDPTEVAAKLDRIFEGYNKATYEYFKIKGVADPEAVLNYGEEILGEGMKKVFFDFMRGDTRGFDSLIREFNRYSEGHSIARFKA